MIDCYVIRCTAEEKILYNMNKTKLQNSWPAYSISLSSPTTLNYCKLGLCNKQHPESRLSMQLLQFPAPGWALEVLLKSKLKHLQRLGRGLGAPCNYQPAPEPGWLCRWETKHSQGRKFQKLNCCLGCGVGLGKEKKKKQPKNTTQKHQGIKAFLLGIC